jgi:hypothetical protein
MDTPVLRSSPQLGSFVDKHHRWVRLLHEGEQQSKCRKAHEATDVHSPPPTKIAVRDEAADERSEERTHEDCGREDGDRQTAEFVVEHICEDGGDDGERTGAEETGEKAADEDSLEIFGDSDSDGEDGEAERGDDNRRTAAV